MVFPGVYRERTKGRTATGGSQRYSRRSAIHFLRCTRAAQAGHLGGVRAYFQILHTICLERANPHEWRAPTGAYLFSRCGFQNAFQITFGEPFAATDWDVKRAAGRIDGMLAYKSL